MDRLVHHKFAENEEINTQGRGLCRVVAILKTEHENGGYVKVDEENYDNNGYDFQDLLLQSNSTGEIIIGSQCRTYENDSGELSVCWGQGHYNLDMKELGMYLSTNYSTRNMLNNASVEFNPTWDFDDIIINRHSEEYELMPQNVFEIKCSGITLNDRFLFPRQRSYEDDVHIGLWARDLATDSVDAKWELVAYCKIDDKNVDITDIVWDRLSFKEKQFIDESFISYVRDTMKNFEHPEMAYSLLPSSMREIDGVMQGDAIIIKWGEQGYYPCFEGVTYTQEKIDSLNSKLGVSKAEAKTMEICSMQDCDWDSHYPKVLESMKEKGIER